MNFLLSKKMKYFIVTMEERCINSAAEKLFITRSPLIKIISELENLIGSKLFNRNYNELIPTNIAIEFYNQLKPLYEILSSVENKFHMYGNKKTSELIFDISVPYNYYKYIVYSLQGEHLNFTHSRILVNQETILRVKNNKHITIISMRDFNVIEGITKETINEDSMELIMATSVTRDDLHDIETMKALPLFIRPCSYVEEIKSRVSVLLGNTLPLIFFKEVDADITTMFYSVIQKKGMLLLPRKFAELHSSASITRVPIKGATYKNIILFNANLKTNQEIQIIKKTLSAAL
ncbi:transcriptional activator [Buttiauxella brennerae ATCC 51605]|uniref:Transcriptional activator n=1 Tax=Buttiauxella brennerae ATCC 51605 TaxID=1354251 RepID=A0A1B7IKD3_9ENTR|nr:LysR family transcriptional regulator [Buttiauxella brennerae]OAT29973.1 transcriptional activator [Buttiauxella brennerae ATCC 51605]